MARRQSLLNGRSRERVVSAARDGDQAMSHCRGSRHRVHGLVGDAEAAVVGLTAPVSVWTVALILTDFASGLTGASSSPAAPARPTTVVAGGSRPFDESTAITRLVGVAPTGPVGISYLTFTTPRVASRWTWRRGCGGCGRSVRWASPMGGRSAASQLA